MPLVTLTNIEKSFGDRVIFRELNFLIDRGERVGLIGDNGTGKTTLFPADHHPDQVGTLLRTMRPSPSRSGLAISRRMRCSIRTIP